MNKTPIEWTDYSVNPLKMRMPDGTLINACVHKSSGCRNCYAETIVRRWWKKEWGLFPGYSVALMKMGTPVLVEEELAAVIRLSERIAKGKVDPNENKIFWNDMTDEFLEFWPDEFIDKCFAVRALTPNLIHQVLTKRPQRMRDYFNDHRNSSTRCLIFEAAMQMAGKDPRVDIHNTESWWPLPNVWLGVSCEDQKTADERIPLLLETPAAVRWISAEPLLGPVSLCDLTNASGNDPIDAIGNPDPEFDLHIKVKPVDWVVTGLESNGRKGEIAWIRSLLKQCKSARIPIFVKQLGSKPVPEESDYQSGIQPVAIERKWPEHVRMAGDRIFLNNKKGGDPSEWPEDLRVREFPCAKAVMV